MGLAYNLRGSVHYHHIGKHGSMQAHMVLEWELQVLHLDPKAHSKRLSSTASLEEGLFCTGHTLSMRNPQSPYRNFLQEYTYSNKVSPTNSPISLGARHIQTSTGGHVGYDTTCSFEQLLRLQSFNMDIGLVAL